jgi:hypothetical protein
MVLAATIAVGGATMHVATASEPRATALQALVDFQRTGGIAGVNDHLVVQPDGRVSKESAGKECTGQLEPAQLATLREDLNRAGISQLPSSERPPAADVFEYEITHNGSTVRTFDTVVPEQLKPVLAKLTKLATTPC